MLKPITPETAKLYGHPCTLRVRNTDGNFRGWIMPCGTGFVDYPTGQYTIAPDRVETQDKHGLYLARLPACKKALEEQADSYTVVGYQPWSMFNENTLGCVATVLTGTELEEIIVTVSFDPYTTNHQSVSITTQGNPKRAFHLIDSE